MHVFIMVSVSFYGNMCLEINVPSSNQSPLPAPASKLMASAKNDFSIPCGDNENENE